MCYEYFILELSIDTLVFDARKLLNEYGKGRWELVTTYEGRDNVLYYFKRPLE